MKSILPVIALLGALALAVPAMARDYTLGSIEIHEPWSRATPPTAPTAGGYMTITNKGTAADRLIAVESPAAANAEIHDMKMEGSVMRMRPVEGGLALPPGQTVALKPGGYHVMFTGLKAPFVKGSAVKATLVFEKAGRIDVDFAVAAMGAMMPMDMPKQ